MRSKFLTFFRKYPVLLLVPAMLVLAWLFTEPDHRVRLGADPEDWFDENGEFSFRYEDCRVRINGNGTWMVTVQSIVDANQLIPVVVSMPERGGGTWRIQGDELILGDQSNQLNRPFDFGGSRLSDDGSFLRLVLPSGRADLVVPRK